MSSLDCSESHDGVADCVLDFAAKRGPTAMLSATRGLGPQANPRVVLRAVRLQLKSEVPEAAKTSVGCEGRVGERILPGG